MIMIMIMIMIMSKIKNENNNSMKNIETYRLQYGPPDIIIWLLFLFLFLSFTPYTFANPQQKSKQQDLYQINKDHSEIKFQIDYLLISKVTGQFNHVEGQFKYHHQKNFLSDINIKLRADSIDTGNKMRDQHLRRNDFFYVTKYPLITFHSLAPAQYDPQGFFIVEGILKLKGVEKRSKIKIRQLGQQKDTWNKDNIFFSFEATINREDFNLNWNKTLDDGKYVLGQLVTLSGFIQAQPFNQLTTSSRYLIPDTKKIRQNEGKYRQVPVNMAVAENSKNLQAPSGELAGENELAAERVSSEGTESFYQTQNEDRYDADADADKTEQEESGNNFASRKGGESKALKTIFLVIIVVFSLLGVFQLTNHLKEMFQLQQIKHSTLFINFILFGLLLMSFYQVS